MRLLVLGAAGQLGRILRTTCPYPGSAFFGRDQLNLAVPRAIEQSIIDFEPQLVVNAAAYTAVERAESEPAAAFAINDSAVDAIGQACSRIGARLLHVSTDYVFDGRLTRPYAAGDEPAPLNTYGASKLAGERKLRAIAGLRYLIVRTSWLYSESGSNFVLSMLRQARQRHQLRVVCDQRGSPTSAWSLARCLWRAAEADQLSGIAHFSDGGALSWHEFAIAIFEEAQSAGLLRAPVTVDPIATSAYPGKVVRPAYSALDCSHACAALAMDMPDWRRELRAVVRRLERIH